MTLDKRYTDFLTSILQDISARVDIQQVLIVNNKDNAALYLSGLREVKYSDVTFYESLPESTEADKWLNNLCKDNTLTKNIVRQFVEQW